MTPMLHTGFERMRFDPGWANQGGDMTLLRQIGSSHRHVAPMTLLYALVYGGVFERHPSLTLLLAEVGTGWLPFVHREIDDRSSPLAEIFLGTYPLPLKPSEYLARNVRATPLSGGNDSPLPRIMDDLPDDMIVFSSDFPHFEGFSDPKATTREVLAPLPRRAASASSAARSPTSTGAWATRCRGFSPTRGHATPRPVGQSPTGPHTPRSLRSAARFARRSESRVGFLAHQGSPPGSAGGSVTAAAARPRSRTPRGAPPDPRPRRSGS